MKGPAPLCACGCKQPVKWLPKRKRWAKWLFSHRSRKHGNPENWDAVQARRDGHMQRAYGISRAEYDDMLARQGYGCEICFSDSLPRGRTRFCVDHDHNTGRVRGLLCSECNTAIGLLQDNPLLLRAAAQYLEGGLK